MENRNIPKTDSIVDSVIDQFIERASFGEKKYGLTLDRTDLTFPEYVTHMKEELMDAILYLEKMESMYNGFKNTHLKDFLHKE